MKSQFDSQLPLHESYSNAKRSVCFFAIASRLHQLGEAVVDWLTSGYEPKIYLVKERSGETRWMLEHPTTHAHISRCSEEDIRAYLNCHYYR